MDGAENYAFSDTFTLVEGYLYCESVRVKDIQNKLNDVLEYPSPVFIYSKEQIRRNIDAYKRPLEDEDIPFILGYAMKANYNPEILRIMKEKWCSATTVSGNELRLAMSAGMEADNIIYNGNGKIIRDLELAVTNQCMINVDSEFDLRHIIKIAKKLQKQARIMLRLNPDIDSVSIDMQ